jgi:hypothetical protein
LLSTPKSEPRSVPPEAEAVPESAPASSSSPQKKKKKKAGSSLPPASRSTPTAAPVERPRRSAAPPEEKRSPAAWIGLAILAVAAGGFVMLRGQKAPEEPVSAAPEPATSVSIAATHAAEPIPSEAPTPAASSATPSVPVAAPGASATAHGTTPPTESGKPEATTASATASAEAAPSAKPSGTEPTSAAPAVTAETEAEIPEVFEAHGPFQPDAARSGLAAAAAEAAACRKDEGPFGVATVLITFAPSGRVTTATISGPPFAGTPVGGCIASKMRKVKVPQFDGEHITVSKAVSIQ